MLRRLLFLLSPSDELLRQKHKTSIQHLQIKCHRWILDTLSNCYGNYAIIDKIKIGEVEILHECRDWEFERELQRITKKNIDKPTLKAIGFPYHGNRAPNSRHFSEFRFTDSLSVLFEGEKYNVRRKEGVIDMEGSMKGVLKYSSYEDILRCTEFVQKVKLKKIAERENDRSKDDSAKQKEPELSIPSESSGSKIEKKGLNKISIKREDPKSLVPGQETKPEVATQPPSPPPIIKKKTSVEIDESFNNSK